ncbi:MAG: 4Fe-4S binding protein [Kiritimatiellae bacterium]|nr:4Fe-4S binding protein [Kiritimatiellia bacterium]
MFNRRNLIRLIIAVAFALLSLGLVPEGWKHMRVALPALSPLLSLGGALAALSVSVVTLLGVPLLLLPLFKGRFFCWRLCPMGFLAESVGRLNFWNKSSLRKIPFVGKPLALLVIGSAAAGYPVLIWTDPLSVFNGFFAAWRMPLSMVSGLTAVGFVMILLTSLLAPNIWCHRLCPLGGLQEMLANLAKRIRAPATATTTERPIENVMVARRTLLGMAVGGFSGIAYRALSGRMSARMSATEALETGGRGKAQGGGCGRAMGRGVGRGRGHCGSDVATAPYIRPPGAAAEAFNALCARCGNCMSACPYGLLVPDLGSSGIDGLFTPVMLFRSRNSEQERFCFQECTACTKVCPTGAISSLTRNEKQQTAIGVAHVSKRKCLAWEKGEYCMVCQEFCPYHAIEEVERNGVMCPVVDTDKCRGCGACESQCPALPIAIVISGRQTQARLAHPSPYLNNAS